MDVDAVVLHSLNGYGVILSAILAYLQLVYQQQQEEGGGVDTKPCFNSPSISLYFTISLVSLGASTPPPPSKLFRICIFSSSWHVLLYVLSSVVPNMLSWVPYLSCIRPLLHLFPDQFQLLILQYFSQYISDAILKLFRAVWDFMKWLVAVNADPDALADAAASLPSQGSFS